MRNWRMQLGIGLVILFIFGVAATAHAFPPQCQDVCSCSSACTTPCWEGTIRSSCEAWICGGCAADLPVSSSIQDAALPGDASQGICTELDELTGPPDAGCGEDASYVILDPIAQVTRLVS